MFTRTIRTGLLVALSAVAAVLFLGSEALAATNRPVQPLTWRLVARDQPSTRIDSFVDFDWQNRRALLYGGTMSTWPLIISGTDTWEFDGTVWKQLSPTPNIPNPRHGAGQMVWDSRRKKMVLVGGNGEGVIGGYHDVWEFDGTAWYQSPAMGPLIGNGVGLAYDEARGEVIMYGGVVDFWTAEIATWAYDGTSWRIIARHNQGPPPRAYPAMAYDPVRQKTLLFGGRYGIKDPTTGDVTDAWYDDTWEWDGNIWLKLNPPGARPSKRNAGGNTVYHHGWQKIVMHGGAEYGCMKDTWIWDGVQWTELQTLNTPSGRCDMCWYDANRDTLMAFGGVEIFILPIMKNETWELADGYEVTPTPQNTPSPTATPLPSGKMGLFISPEWNAEIRELFVGLQIYNRNQTGAPIPVHLYAAVEVYGQFYFHPSYTTTAAITSSFDLQPNYDSGRTEMLRIQVPDPLSVAIPTTWYAIMLHQATMTEVGQLHSAPLTLTP